MAQFRRVLEEQLTTTRTARSEGMQLALPGYAGAHPRSPRWHHRVLADLASLVFTPVSTCDKCSCDGTWNSSLVLLLHQISNSPLDCIVFSSPPPFLQAQPIALAEAGDARCTLMNTRLTVLVCPLEWWIRSGKRKSTMDLQTDPSPRLLDPVGRIGRGTWM